MVNLHSLQNYLMLFFGVYHKNAFRHLLALKKLKIKTIARCTTIQLNKRVLGIFRKFFIVYQVGELILI